MKKIILCALVLCQLSFNNRQLHAQNTLPTIELEYKDSIKSSILKEQRKFSVKLPNGFDKSQKYPVIYVLDGEMYFPIVTAVQNFLDRNKRFASNKSIIVAIENTDRTRDLTPSAAVSSKGHGTMENSGKAEQFYQFITSELIPEISHKYAVSDRKLLIGHSFGGLTATYFFLEHPNSFSDYLIMEPSMWWDNGKLLNAATKKLQANHYEKNTRVFFAFASKEDSTRNSIEKLVGQLQPEIALKYAYYPNENHGSVYLPALYDGLRFLFDIKVERKPRM
ncbi:alpha/beta hydrolase [Rhizosphaericola mali]|uniref:Alpha/beta hydrolase n=1 Tax=Rhizosphaericola mali TaxID=2545455 RepID=A0A5P2G9A6_9BACT|nr:alpha/beta hydrolase-fold protein [Rhizosphaericola mali]QES90300.1 alpha/beta hydrolase [Rhizosphaericola mali]